MKLFHVKDNFGELHIVMGEAVNYVEHQGQLIEARVVGPQGEIVAVFKQWHYIKQGAVVPPGTGAPPAPKMPSVVEQAS